MFTTYNFPHFCIFVLFALKDVKAILRVDEHTICQDMSAMKIAISISRCIDVVQRKLHFQVWSNLSNFRIDIVVYFFISQLIFVCSVARALILQIKTCQILYLNAMKWGH